MKPRLTYFVSHPIQYQAPLLRRISGDPSIDLQVIFEKDFSTDSHFDHGFQTEIRWDVPLRDGYNNSLLIDTDVEDLIRESDAIWLHGWESLNFRKILYRASQLGKPVLMRGENWSAAPPEGSGLRKVIKRIYLNKIFENCSAFLTIGTRNRDYYLAHGVSPKILFDMPYAVDNLFFSTRANAESANVVRASLGVGSDRKIILFAGKFTKRKNPQFVLAAWKALIEQMSQQPLLIFVGDGEMRTELELNSPKDVVFTGFLNQTSLPAYYAAADVFVLMSEMEPWGLAINEAMASGTAVIASDQCGAAYDLIDDDTGRMVEVGNQPAFMKALLEVLSDTEEMGKAAKKKISLWDFEADMTGLKSAIESIL